MQESSIPILIQGEEQRYDGTVTLKTRYVRLVKDSDLKDFFDSKKRGSWERKYGLVSNKDRAELIYLIRLWAAIPKKDKPAITNAIESYLDATWKPSGNEDVERFYEVLGYIMNDALRAPLYYFNRELNSWLRKVRVIIWWSKRYRRLFTGLYCEDIITALFCVWVTRISQPRGMSICPRCGTPFERSRKLHKYCNTYCQNAAAVARSRKRKRDKLK